MSEMKLQKSVNLQMLGQNLLEKVEMRARQENYSNAAIQTIAREQLQAIDCELLFDPGVWADFIQSTSVPQGRHWFSDIPLVLARNRNFYVELLCWMSATTDIHAHAFCGAFRVMQGSSVHTRYRFDPTRWVSDSLGLGRLECEGSEYLHGGTVREIVPGRDGLVHSLFHLDSPSLTLLVRTHTTVAAKPQLGFFPPGLAIDNPGLQQDEEVRHLTRLLAAVGRKDRASVAELLLQTFKWLDAARLVQLCLSFSTSFSSEEDRHRLVDVVTRYHDEELAYILDETLLRLGWQRQIRAARETVDDPEVRFFLALLLNLRDRSTIFRVVQARFPERNPAKACAEWLLSLSRLRSNAIAFMQEVATRSEGPGYRLGSRIASRIPAGNTLEAVQLWLRDEDQISEDGAAVSNPLLDLPELAPLFRK